MAYITWGLVIIEVVLIAFCSVELIEQIIEMENDKDGNK